MSKKVVLITGTNSGFGRLTAQSLAASGHTVYATIRDTKGKNADQAKALEQIENITVLDVTLTDETSVKNAFEAVIAKEGKIDVLVNNAGTGLFGVAESATTADFQKIMDVNLMAPWTLMKLALPFMRKQREGLIVNVSSGWGRFSAPFSVIYNTSKFALEGLSEGLHYELKPLGVDVAIVQPGVFPTEMSQKIQTGSDLSVVDDYKEIADVPNKLFAAIGNIIETGKPDPQEVADAIVNLVNLPKGQRPLRTVVDTTTGEFTKRANDSVAKEYYGVIKRFGMEDLLY